MTRPVDAAMAADDATKRAIRELWAEECARYVDQARLLGVPLYLTLPGAQGRDIRVLMERHVIRAAETGAVADDDKTLIVGVESSPEAEYELKTSIPGLKTLQMPIQNILQGHSLEAWPNDEYRVYCRALVVNLDFDGSLRPKHIDGEIIFPALRWIQKFGHIHTGAPRVTEWTLMLTFNAAIDWPQEVCDSVCEFLAGNLRRVPEFRALCERWLGEELVTLLVAGSTHRLSTLEERLKQAVLMAYVPKKIADLVRHQGWKIDTIRNIRYMGGGDAPMVTWIFRMSADARAAGDPDVVYQESVAGSLANAEDFTAA